MMKLLVVYGSKRLGTAGIAETLAAEFREQGVEVDVRPARLAGEIDGYQAVIVGRALYSNRWHRDAFRFVRQNTRVLTKRPVWCDVIRSELIT